MELVLYNPTEAGNVLLRSIGVIRDAEISIQNNNLQIDPLRRILDEIEGQGRGLPRAALDQIERETHRSPQQLAEIEHAPVE